MVVVNYDGDGGGDAIGDAGGGGDGDGHGGGGGHGDGHGQEKLMGTY